MLNGLSTLVRLLSRIACLIVVASFVLFALDQTSSASEKQQNEVNAIAPASERTNTPAKPPAQKQESGVRKAIDEASAQLTSPFKEVTAGSRNQWAIRGVGLVLALLAYGFGLGYLARMLRVRV
jgi:hypothetical protein